MKNLLPLQGNPAGLEIWQMNVLKSLRLPNQILWENRYLVLKKDKLVVCLSHMDLSVNLLQLLKARH